MSFLTLTIAVCIGVFAGMWLFNALGPLFKLVLCIVAAAGVWFGGLFSSPGEKKKRLNKKPLILVSLAVLLLFGVFAWAVNEKHSLIQEGKKLAQSNENAKPVVIGRSPFSQLGDDPLKIGTPLFPEPVEVTPPPALDPVVPAPVRIVPAPPSATRIIYIDGRKGHIRSLSVLWEGGEVFEDVDLRELPFATQLVPLPPRLHHKNR